MSDLFDEKAKDWDMNERIQQLSAAVSATLLQTVPLNQQMHIMDFGAGTGLLSSAIAPLVNQITAVDISQAMLDKLAAKPELANKINIACQNILETPLNQQFDLIISAMAMHHVEDTQRLIQCFASHLKPDAMIAIADLDKEDGSFHPADTQGVFHFGFERSDLKNTLETHGFQQVEFTTAHTVINDKQQAFPIFLVTAKKS